MIPTRNKGRVRRWRATYNIITAGLKMVVVMVVKVAQLLQQFSSTLLS
jgi:hypothetical protein